MSATKRVKIMFITFKARLARFFLELGARLDADEVENLAYKWGNTRGLRFFRYKRIGKSEYVSPLSSLIWFKVGKK